MFQKTWRAGGHLKPSSSGLVELKEMTINPKTIRSAGAALWEFKNIFRSQYKCKAFDGFMCPQLSLKARKDTYVQIYN